MNGDFSSAVSEASAVPSRRNLERNLRRRHFEAACWRSGVAAVAAAAGVKVAAVSGCD